MKENKPLYPYSWSEAKRSGQMELWRESHHENCACARAIEQKISDGYQDNRLSEKCAKEVIEAYGYDRVNWVLANTVLESMHDGRYSEVNKTWSRGFSIPKETLVRNSEFAVHSHPGLVDLVIRQAWQEWQKLGLFDKAQCYDESPDYTHKVVAIRPDALKDEYKTPKSQLFYAKFGNGCRAESLGRKVFGQHLDNGEEGCYLRTEILGVVKLELLPDWAKEKLSELTDAANLAQEIKTTADAENPGIAQK